jgi:hypothetical protein
MHYEIEHEHERNDGSILTVKIGYTVSPVVPASISGPEEGGVEIEYISVTDIRWTDDDGNDIKRKPTIEELTAAEQAFPDSTAWELATADYARRDDEAREQAAEDRAERLAEARGSEGGY